MFQILAEFLKEIEPGPSFSQMVHDHLSQLIKEFEHYFPATKDPRSEEEWICSPFVNMSTELNFSLWEEDLLLEIANDSGFKNVFQMTSNVHSF